MPPKKKSKRDSDDEDEDFEIDLDIKDDDVDDLEEEVDEDFVEPEPAPSKSKGKSTTTKAKSKGKAKAKSSDDEDDEPAPKSKAKTTGTKRKASEKSTATKSKSTSKSDSKSAKGSAVKAIRSETEAAKVILEYLQKQNRPYSIQNVIDNLHGAVKKAVTQKALDMLAKKGDIICKENGKAKVYFVNQDTLDVCSAAELAEMDAEMKSLAASIDEVKKETNSLQAEKTKMVNALTDDQLDEEIQKLEAEIERKKAKLAELTGGVQLATTEEKTQASAELEKYKTMWRKRKRLALDIVDGLCEKLDKRRKTVLEELGIETDEELGVSIDTVGKIIY